MASDLLKEAIADAKQVRETAIANARAMLEEAFAPKLNSMISSRLRQEAEELTEDNDASSEIGGAGLTVDDPAPKNPSKKSSASSHIENPGQEVEPFGEGPVVEGIEDISRDDDDLGLHAGDTDVDDLGVSDEPDDVDINIDVDAEPAPDAGLDAQLDEPMADLDLGAGSDIHDQHGDVTDEEEPDDLDLEAIIRELEADSGEDHSYQEGFDDVRAGQEVDGPVKAMRNLRKEAAEGTLESGKDVPDKEGVPGGKEVSPGQEVSGTAAETMTEELTLEDILREMEAEEDAEKDSKSYYEDIATENVELKKSLREHREVIQFLKENLQEVNMLNAKLLYTNKLFRNFALNNPQKTHIVETFDRASTMREVKLVYSTLAESLSGKSGGQNRRKASTRSITEGMASKATGSTKSKTPARTLNEDTDDKFKARMQQLAGIKIL